jgi:hypothetical protein
VIAMTVTTPPAPVPTSPVSRPWSVGRILAAAGAALFLLLGAGLLLGGATLHFVDSNLRDSQGYFMGPTEAWDSPGYAVRSDVVVLHRDAGMMDLPRWLLGTVRVTADPATPDGVFVGVARTVDVDRYLRGVAWSTAGSSADHQGPMMPLPTFVEGGPPAVPPTAATFWAASASGADQQTLDWEPRAGSWTIVVMSGEGTTPIAADVAVGVTAPSLDDLGTALLVAGFVVVALATTGMWLAIGRR